MARGRGQICILPATRRASLQAISQTPRRPTLFPSTCFPHPAVGSADPPHNRPEHPARGLLASLDAGLQMLLVRRTLEGVPRRVLHVKARDLAGVSARRERIFQESH